MIVERISISFTEGSVAPIVIDPDRIRPELPYMIDRFLNGGVT